jgi:hypothetical protein
VLGAIVLPSTVGVTVVVYIGMITTVTDSFPNPADVLAVTYSDQ